MEELGQGPGGAVLGRTSGSEAQTPLMPRIDILFIGKKVLNTAICGKIFHLFLRLKDEIGHDCDVQKSTFATFGSQSDIILPKFFLKSS